MNPFDQFSLHAALSVFAAGVVVVVYSGTKITKTADQLADRTGLGEAVAGGVLLGAVTSLPGVVVSVSAGFDGQPDLALGNAIGGIAVQTLFLALADLAYRRANLEHAAASLPNVVQAGLLIALITLIGLGRFTTNMTVLGAHPTSWLLLVAYGYGLKVVAEVRRFPTWSPQQTNETRADEPEDDAKLPSLSRLWTTFVPLALILAVTGWILESSVSRIVELTALEASVAGLFVTSISTSLPELITAVAAVRRGALTLAVGGIVGGNTFDTLFAAAADFSYRGGSLYHDVSEAVTGWIFLCVFMMSVLLLGMLRREKHGVAGIGVEGVTVIACYVLGLFTILSH